MNGFSNQLNINNVSHYQSTYFKGRNNFANLWDSLEKNVKETVADITIQKETVVYGKSFEILKIFSV